MNARELELNQAPMIPKDGWKLSNAQGAVAHATAKLVRLALLVACPRRLEKVAELTEIVYRKCRGV